ncbi:MAG: DUF6580 family putative transport protein [Sphingomonadales bacterium]
MNTALKYSFFTLMLVALTTACKFFFGPEIALSGFSPVIAIALFSGYVFSKKEGLFTLPLLSLLLSDLFIQGLYQQGLFEYPGIYGGQWKNYLLLLSATLLGALLGGRNYRSLSMGAMAAPTMFFVLSNFMVWLSASETIYAKNLGGLMTCYTAGLPFYRNSLVGTFVFLPVILVLFNYLESKKTAMVLAR